MPVCGPKCSICCSIISLWGIIMLAILGGLLYIKSLAFVDDMAVGVGADSEHNNTLDALEERYVTTAYGCWLSVGLYAVTFVFSLQQYYANKRMQNFS